ncbi:MAG: GNAT family N-acetyltransferase [Spirulinaceae cyanobacterium RM2_2_10]|nr:GNAT family N-acetyltransferase [Spirulinaceae cyanobacterium SM2_1_0]NJO18826.1 GNAT family N-acetyltransferase [Spirulinaceae cyanobacterium RM2_2_10]
MQITVVRYARASEPIQFIRRTVFQDEQGVAPALEFDGLDDAAEHLLAYLDGRAVGTARWRGLEAGIAKIERLAVLADARGSGLGKRLMQTAIARVTASGFRTAVIHAQVYVEPLYTQLGFEAVGDRFDEAGIPHVKMHKPLR